MESVRLDCPRVAVVVALPVIEAICLPVRACLLMMRLEAAASAVVGLSLLLPPITPGPPPAVPMTEVGGEGGEAVGGRVWALEDEEGGGLGGAGREEMAC